MDHLDPWSHLAHLGARMRSLRDPFFADGDAVCEMRSSTYLTQVDLEEFLHTDYSDFPCPAPDCPAVFTQLIDFESHYSTLHRHECSQCGKHLPSAHILELHLCESHDSFFAVTSQRKMSFACILQRCRDVFWNATDRKKHCIEKHQFPEEFMFDQVSPLTEEKVTRLREDSMEVDQNENEKSRQKSSQRPCSMSPKLKYSHSQRNSTEKRNKFPRPHSALIPSPDMLAKLQNSPSKKIPGSKIPVSSRTPTYQGNEKEHVKDRIPNVTPRSNSKSLVTLHQIDKEVDDVSRGSESPVRKVETKDESRRLSLAMITGNYRDRSSRGESEDVIRKISTKSDGAVISGAVSNDEQKRRYSERNELDASPIQTRRPLSLARMGERLSQSRPSVTMDFLTAQSNGSSSTHSTSSASACQSSSSPPSSTSTSPIKRSRIPVFKRSQSLKVPKVISFGRDAEKAFVMDKPHWYSRADGQKATPSKLSFSANSFEVEMRDALDDCLF